MHVFDSCQAVPTDLDSEKPIRKIWNILQVNTLKWGGYPSAGFPIWGDRLAIKHERAIEIAIASLGLQPVCTVFIRFFVALDRSTGILYCLCNLDILYMWDNFVNEMSVPK